MKRLVCFAVGCIVGAICGYGRGKRVSAVLDEAWNYTWGVD